MEHQAREGTLRGLGKPLVKFDEVKLYISNRGFGAAPGSGEVLRIEP